MAIGSRLRHIVESQQFSRAILEEVFARADEMKSQPHHFSGRLNGQLMAALFYEPSTRTRLSFEAAMLRLGGRTIGTDNAREFSSAAKGETLEDTIRIVSGYADVIVLRHYEEGAARRAAAASSVPVINAGDGPGQHRAKDGAYSPHSEDRPDQRGREAKRARRIEDVDRHQEVGEKVERRGASGNRAEPGLPHHKHKALAQLSPGTGTVD